MGMQDWVRISWAAGAPSYACGPSLPADCASSWQIAHVRKSGSRGVLERRGNMFLVPSVQKLFCQRDNYHDMTYSYCTVQVHRLSSATSLNSV
jgi:hypothetical protein